MRSSMKNGIIKPRCVSHISDIDEGFVEEYTKRLVTAQVCHLDPLKEDIAEWLNKTLSIDYLNVQNLFYELDNGALLCNLAVTIRDHIKQVVSAGVLSGVVPCIRSKWFERATRGSFYSRDNTENFILFSRSLGVHENLIFESDDLVLHHHPRNVILCLLEVARLASKYGVEPPGLIQLEKDIVEAEKQNGSSDSDFDSVLSWGLSKASSFVQGSAVDRNSTINGVSSDTDTDWSRNSGEDFELDMAENDLYNELDYKVKTATQLVQRNCKCKKSPCNRLKIHKISEGKYNIAGKIVFVRLLKGRHMMVRVGGGWDTLEHFLIRHNSCLERKSSHDNTAKITSTNCINP